MFEKRHDNLFSNLDHAFNLTTNQQISLSGLAVHVHNYNYYSI